MCGIAGFLDPQRTRAGADLARIAAAMADNLHHRGPDEGGTFVDESAGIALGHRRLSIVDLSAAGRQPMASASGRIIVSYNGEIYNAAELKAALDPAISWRGHSDTEVLAEAIAAWGLERAVAAAAGMFAIAVWDCDRRTLSLVRDRFGKKPLYVARQGGRLLFGSELRALRAHPDFVARIDRDALAGFVRRGHYLEPDTVYAGVRQLLPGHILTIDATSGKESEAPYWSLRDKIASARRNLFTGSDAEAADALERQLFTAVEGRMIADVPLGAFLSGGYDSSTVVALMQARARQPVRTFSIGFSEAAYDESPFAREVARHLGTDHTEFMVTPKETRDVIPLLPDIYDEPFADSSQIPTYLVSKLARSQVTVALSGDGGDELFAGYNRYHWGERLRRRVGGVPVGLRHLAAAGLGAIPLSVTDRLAGLIPAGRRPQFAGDKLRKLAGILALDGPGVYRRLTSQWPDCDGVVIGARERLWPTADADLEALLPDAIERMQYYDTLGYLPGDILAKVDRASMAVSLETRAPLLDHRVAEFAWSLPMHMKIRGGKAKWLLRQVLYRHVPPALVDRPKAGFSVPVGEWLKHELRDWAEDLLDARALHAAGYFDPVPIRALWRDHLTGARNGQYALWGILMFEAWRRRHHAETADNLSHHPVVAGHP